jgi:hypothetical protein
VVEFGILPKKGSFTGPWWLTPVILTMEAEIRRILVQSQPGQIVLQDLIVKKPFTKTRATKDQKSYVLPHMWTLDQGQTQ